MVSLNLTMGYSIIGSNPIFSAYIDIKIVFFNEIKVCFAMQIIVIFYNTKSIQLLN